MTGSEICFDVEQEADGGYVAAAIGESIVTQADTLKQLRERIKEAVECHFEGRKEVPKLIRLNIVHREVFSI